MASSECGRAVIAGYVGQLLEHCFNPFKGKCFRCIVVQEIGIPSISLFSLIDQSVMLNSPFLPNVLFDGVGQDIVFEITIARKEF